MRLLLEREAFEGWPGHGQGLRGVPLGMQQMNPEYPDPDSSDRSLPADILLRQEPEDEEEEDEEERAGGEIDDDGDEGYSE